MPQTIHHPHPCLWIAQSEVYATNSGVFLLDDAACLVDPALLPEDMLGIQRLLHEQHIKPDYLILTHYHWDHLFGPERFPDVPVIAQSASQSALTAQDIERLQANIIRFEREYRVQRGKPFQIPIPDITFDARMTIQPGDLRLELMHAPGHSPDQCVIYQPGAGILWAADMLSDLEIPFVYHSLPAYQATLGILSELDVRLLVPGHGQLTQDAGEIGRRFDEDMAYLVELRQRVEDALQAGWTLEEAQTACAGMRFKHPEDNAAPHRLNVEIAYNQGLDSKNRADTAAGDPDQNPV